MPAVQLITPLWGPLATNQAAQVLSDSNTDFLVVGVCSSELTLAPALVAALAGKQSAAAAGKSQQLPGLQMHVSPRDRIIVLDASAMLSPLLLAALLSTNRPQPAVGSTAAAAVRAAARKAGGSSSSSSSVPVEGVALLLTLQLLVFLCSVCNVVVISTDSIDLQLLQLLEASGLIAASLPNISSNTQQLQQQQQNAAPRPPSAPSAAAQGGSRPGTSRSRGPPHHQQQQQQQTVAAGAAADASGVTAAPAAAAVGHVADMVMLHTSGCQTNPNPRQQQQQQQLVDTCLASTAWHSRPRPLLLQQHPADLTGQLPPVKQPDLSSSSSSSSGGASIWTIRPSPPPPPGAAGGVSTPLRLSAELQQLVNRLLHFPRTPPSSITSSSSSSGVFGSVMSEGEWLRGAERVWDAVQDSSQLLGYYRAAAEARLVGAGGWGAGAAQLSSVQPGRETW